MTFSSAGRLGSRWNDWNTNPPRAARTRSRPSSSSAESSLPSKNTWPVVGRSRPASRPSRGDLPAPEAPTTATASPGKMLRPIPSSRGSSPSGLATRFVSFRAEMIGCISTSAIRRILLFAVLIGLHPGMHAETVLVLGDSLSAGYGIEQNLGWVNLLRQRIAAQKIDAEVVNASVRGETAAGGRARIAEQRNAFQPDGIHPTAAMQPRILDNVWPALLPLLAASSAARAASQ